MTEGKSIDSVIAGTPGHLLPQTSEGYRIGMEVTVDNFLTFTYIAPNKIRVEGENTKEEKITFEVHPWSARHDAVSYAKKVMRNNGFSGQLYRSTTATLAEMVKGVRAYEQNNGTAPKEQMGAETMMKGHAQTPAKPSTAAYFPNVK